MTETQLRPNHFEDLIDEEMIHVVANGDQEIIDYLSSLSQDEQRPAILSVLDKNVGLFDKIMNVMSGEYIPKTEYVSHVVEMMRKYVEVGDTEKKKFGEVMTPIWLVEDMLNKLPEEVWSNPDLKWLDPASGCGVFPSVIVHRLMQGLAGWQPDEKERYKHIVENMLYVCELQAKNMFLHLCAFDPEDVFLLNIFHGSFLSKEFDDHMKNIWGIEGFDIIIGNPPYQELKPGNKRSKAIWQHFVLKSLETCVKNGLMSMVHPSGWRDVSGWFKKVQKAILSRQVQYLEMHDINDGKKTFGATTAYDFYVVKNVIANGALTKITCIDGAVEFRCLDNMDFVPSSMYETVFNLISKDCESVSVVDSWIYEYRKSHMSSIQDQEHVLPCIMNVSDIDKVGKTWWTSKNLGHFGIPKIVIGRLGPGIYVDAHGEYGMCGGGAIGIVDKAENLENIKKAMQSDGFKKIMKACKVGGIAGQVYNPKVIALFKKDFWKEFI